MHVTSLRNTAKVGDVDFPLSYPSTVKFQNWQRISLIFIKKFLKIQKKPTLNEPVGREIKHILLFTLN